MSTGAVPRGRAENPLGAAVLRQSWFPEPAASNNSWPLQGSWWECGGELHFSWKWKLWAFLGLPGREGVARRQGRRPPFAAGVREMAVDEGEGDGDGGRGPAPHGEYVPVPAQWLGRGGLSSRPGVVVALRLPRFKFSPHMHPGIGLLEAGSAATHLLPPLPSQSPKKPRLTPAGAAGPGRAQGDPHTPRKRRPTPSSSARRPV